MRGTHFDSHFANRYNQTIYTNMKQRLSRNDFVLWALLIYGKKSLNLFPTCPTPIMALNLEIN